MSGFTYLRRPPSRFVLALVCSPLTLSPALAETAPGRLDCAREREGLRSEISDQSTAIRFVNESGADKIVYWLNFDGLRVFYARLAPGEGYDQQTFVTHPWVVTSDSYGTCEALFTPAAVPTVAQLR